MRRNGSGSGMRAHAEVPANGALAIASGANAPSATPPARVPQARPRSHQA